MIVVIRFGKKGKLCTVYIGPYEVLHREGNVAYGLRLPNDLISFHLVFHVSMHKKCLRDLPFILPF